MWHMFDTVSSPTAKNITVDANAGKILPLLVLTKYSRTIIRPTDFHSANNNNRLYQALSR